MKDKLPREEIRKIIMEKSDSTLTETQIEVVINMYEILQNSKPFNVPEI